MAKGETLQACLVFTAKPSFTDTQSAADYITITPAIEKTVQAAGDRLCVSGFAYGTSYLITARKGLRGADGSISQSDETLAFNLGNARAAMNFADDGFILPRSGTETLPLRTVNIARVHVTVDRITDRVLARTALAEDSYSYTDDDGNETGGSEGDQTLGARVFEGDMAVKSLLNQAILTGLPVPSLLGARKPGAYRIVVSYRRPGGDDDSRLIRNRWIIDSDIMLTTHRGDDGLHVFARSLATAKPAAGVDITLIAADNDELGQARTNSDGHAVFPAGLTRGERGLRPRMVMAYAGDDFAVLDLDRADIDLSDRGVAGRAAPAGIDAFLYADRGIFRPGETIELAGLLRDQLAHALPDVKLSISLQRPDGVTAAKYTSTANSVGAFALPVPVSPTAARGTWHLQVTPAGSPDQIGDLAVEVQDFVPNRLRVDVSPQAPRLPRDGTTDIDVATRYLYGAPAANLTVDGTVVVQRDTAPVPETGWTFGVLDDAGANAPQDLPSTKTDANGHAQLVLEDSKLTRPTGDFPLVADITVAVAEPGGRATQSETHVPMATHDVLIGLRQGAAHGDDELQTIDIDAAAFAADGSRTSRHNLAFALVEEVTEFGYYAAAGGGGGWGWRTITHDRPVSFGNFDIASSGGRVTTPPLGWGRYRIDVTDPDGGEKSQLRFYSGFYAPAGRDTPERATVTLIGKPPREGETAHLKITPPFAGEALITVENNRVLGVRTATIPAAGATIDVAATADWGPGAYVMATIYRPVHEAPGHAPVRAIGLAWVPVDPHARTLGVAINAPDVLRPRTHINMPLAISNIPAGEDVYLTLAAVDEGILQLTRFETPNPESYFFGQRQLGVTLRDDYAHLIDGDAAAAGEVRSGGDIDGAGLSVVPTRTTALFSGLVHVGADGHASVPLDLPDFNGGLRLMAVAASASALGHADRQTPTRDPVVGEISLPRFLAPGDAASLTLLTHNVDAPAGTFHVHIGASGAVTMKPVDEDVALAAAAQRVATYPIGGGDPGIGTVAMTLDGPNALHIARNWQIEVRPSFQAVSRISADTQNPGTTYRLTPNLADGLYPAGTQFRITYSATGRIDLAGLLSALDDYPFGCSEQLTSRALPLLYLEKIAAAVGGTPPDDMRLRVQQAISTLLERQDDTGAFGLWRNGDHDATPYLGAYITDFLVRAQAAGYAVPKDAIDRAFKGLDTIANNGNWDYDVYWWRSPWEYWRTDVTNIGLAYTALLKARTGRADIGELRYFSDTKLTQLAPLGQAQLGAALSLAGDKLRGATAFDRAEKDLAVWGDEKFYTQGDFYRSELRDTAEMVVLAQEIGDEPRLRRLLDHLEHMESRPQEMETQQQAWLAVAAGSLIARSGGVSVRVGDEEKQNPALITVIKTLASLGNGIDIANLGHGPVLRSVVVRGLPRTAPPATESGLTISKTIMTLDGKPVDLDHLQQNQRLLVHLEGGLADDVYHQAMIVDLLPSAFEIERIVPQSTDDKPNGFAFLGRILDTRMAQKQDDRLLAAVDLTPPPRFRGTDWDDRDRFNIAYIVRVVTPGHFTLPAASIRDMYRPDVIARGEPSSVTVEPAH
ncbi:MAG TPA: alpha-2-macroglobulin [Acetobacteraceae bacterium]|nr:alpha-2-macroglobulin [Acetobacteraceae bacterium]